MCVWGCVWGLECVKPIGSQCWTEGTDCGLSIGPVVARPPPPSLSRASFLERHRHRVPLVWALTAATPSRRGDAFFSAVTKHVLSLVGVTRSRETSERSDAKRFARRCRVVGHRLRRTPELDISQKPFILWRISIPSCDYQSSTGLLDLIPIMHFSYLRLWLRKTT